jgi:hypothetical protein
LLSDLACSNNQLASIDLSNTICIENAEWGLLLYGNKHKITITDNTFDLSTLPTNFDVTKASDWTNATVKGNILTIEDITKEVTYTYDCGLGFSDTFALVPQIEETPAETTTATTTVTTTTTTAAPETTTTATTATTTTSTTTSTASETSVASASPTASGKSAVLSSDQGQMEEQTALQIIPEEVVAFSKSSFSLFTNVAPRNDITVSSNHFGVMASSGISHSNRELQSMEIISQAEHSLPLNLGVQVQFELGEKISAGVGLSYTLLKSRYEALVNKKYHNVKQSLHYIGVPVNLYFSLMQSSKFKFYANVGGAVEKGVKASYRLTSYDGSSLSAKADIEGFQYAANFGLGLEYRFSKPCGIYLEPNAVYFFDSKVPASVRTDQPFQLKAEVGFRFHL